MVRFSWSSLRGRLLFLVLMAVAPAVGLVLYSGLEQRRRAAADALLDAQRLVRVIASEQDRLVGAARTLLVTLAQLPAVRSQDSAACSTLLADLRKAYPIYTNLGVATLTGDVVCSAVPFQRTVGIADRRYFQRTVEMRNFTVGDYQVGRITRRGGLNFGYPIFDERDQVRGIVFAALDLTWPAILVAQAQLPPGSTLTLVDRNGTVLAHQPDSERWVGHVMPEAPLVQAALNQSGEGTAELLDLDGIRRLYAFAPLSDIPEEGVEILIGIPTTIALAEVNRALARNLIGLGIVALLVLGMAWVGSDLLVLRHVNALVRGSERLSQGDLGARAGLPLGSGELGNLAAAFDRMAESLEHRVGELRKAEAALRRSNRGLRVLSEYNQVLVRAVDEGHLLQEVCRLLVTVGGYRLAWIGFAELVEKKTIRPVAQAGCGAGDIGLLSHTWADTELGRGPTGTAIRTGGRSIVRDVLADPSYAPWRAEAAKYGYASAAALPLMNEDKTLGALTICAAEPDAIDPEELQLLTELANDLAFGIVGLRSRAEHRQAEDQLRLQSAALVAAASAIVITDRDGRIAWANPAFARLTGYTLEETLGKTPRLLKSDQQDPAIYRSLWETILSGQVWRGVLYNRRKDGSVYLEGQTITPVRDERGEISHFIAIKQDITERKRAEEALLSRTQQLETVRAINEEITRELDLRLVLDLITRRAVELVGASSAMLRLWDEEAGLLVPQSWVGVEEGRGTLTLRLGEGVAGTAAQQRQGLFVNDFRRSPYRTPLLLEITTHTAVLAEPLLYRDRLVGVISLNRDESGRPFREEDCHLLALFGTQAAIAIENSRLYEELRTGAIQLEARVEDRTRELLVLNQQLEAASSAKSEFLANMSHEIRTPLNSILGFSEILQGADVGPLTDRQARYLRHIRQSGEHLLQVINDILDLSKVEAGKVILQLQPLPVASTLEDSLVIARGLANKKGQTIQTEFAPDLPPLHADPVRFKQIMFNLLSNAVKFTPTGGRITVRVRRVSGIADFKLQIADLGERECAVQSEIINLQSAIPGDFLEIAVTDTGIGIKPEDLPRLFREFVQLEATAGRQHEGTGLGLALTKRLVELHGGRIWAESPGEGHGSTFAVLLPFGSPGV